MGEQNTATRTSQSNGAPGHCCGLKSALRKQIPAPSPVGAGLAPLTQRCQYWVTRCIRDQGCVHLHTAAKGAAHLPLLLWRRGSGRGGPHFACDGSHAPRGARAPLPDPLPASSEREPQSQCGGSIKMRRGDGPGTFWNLLVLTALTPGREPAAMRCQPAQSQPHADAPPPPDHLVFAPPLASAQRRTGRASRTTTASTRSAAPYRQCPLAARATLSFHLVFSPVALSQACC